MNPKFRVTVRCPDGRQASADAEHGCDAANQVGILARVLASGGTTNGIPPGITVNIQEIGRENDWLNISITRQQRATLIAALRFYQWAGQGEPCNRSDEIHDLATCGGEEISLDDAGIDELCAELTFFS